MPRTAINLYSVRDLDEPMLEIIQRVADAGYDGVQFSGGLRDATFEAVAAKLEETGLAVTGAHVGIEQIETDLESTALDYGETLGCDSLVVPILDASAFETAEAVDETAARLEALSADAAEEALGLSYHNHAHEFLDVGGELAMERLIEKTTTLQIELDVGWAAAGGSDPAALLADLGERAPLVHMKDMDVETETPVEIGEGDVDMQACADTAREQGAEWLIYEHDNPSDPAASIDHGADFLDSL